MFEFLIPSHKMYPIKNGDDIKKAIEVFHKMDNPISYSEFLNRIYEVSKKLQILDSLPNKIKKKLGIKKENRAESQEEYVSHKKPIKYRRSRHEKDNEF